MLKSEDAQAYFELSQNEGFRNFQISDYRRSSVDDAKQWIDKIADSHSRSGFGIVGVFTKNNGVLIGLAALKYLEAEGTSPVEIMYRLSDIYWKQGYGAEVAFILTQYAFNNMKLAVLVATVDPRNAVSKKIIINLGFRFKKMIKIESFEEELYELLADQSSNLDSKQ